MSLPDPLNPPQLDEALQAKLHRWARTLEPDGNGYALAREHAPTHEDRQALQARLAEIKPALLPADRGIIAHTIDRFEKAGLASRRAPEADVDSMLDEYVEDLRDLPKFAVLNACRDFRLGKAGNRKFVPSVAQIREQAEIYAERLYREERQIRDVLSARVFGITIDPERRATLAELARRSAREMEREARKAERVRRGLSPELTPEDPEHALQRLATFDAPRLSKAVLDTYGRELPKQFAKLPPSPKVKRKGRGKRASR